MAQFSSVAQSCLTLCDPMNRSTPGLPVHHQLPEFTQTHAHRVGDAIQYAQAIASKEHHLQSLFFSTVLSLKPIHILNQHIKDRYKAFCEELK